jgi:tetratricopeptide (TPR) repeat protein
MKHKPLVPEKMRASMRQAATEFWQQGKYSDYFEMMDRVFRAHPADYLISIDIGSAHAMRYDYATSQEWFERAVYAAADKSDALTRIAVQCRNFNRFDLAERYLERSSQQKGVTPDTLSKLAEMHERMRSLDKARQMTDRALQLDPSNVLAMLVSARLDRSAGHLESAERTLRSFLNRADTDSWSTRIRGWYELGANLDLQGRYDEAMAAFVSAKRMIRPVAGGLIASHRQTQAILQHAAETITPDILKRWAEEAAAAAPSPELAVICGHPRSGTTLLEQVLDSHPGIVSAEEVPTFYESYRSLKHGLPPDASMLQTLQSASPSRLAQARAWYLQSMQAFIGKPIGDRLLIDKNPTLTGLLPALTRLFPTAPVLIAVRDPRDVCLSCFMQPLPLNPVSASYLTLDETAVEYASLMGFWLSMKPRLSNPAIEVRDEDIVDDIELASRRVLSFLNLDWNPCVLQFHQHAKKKLVRSPTYADVARPITRTAVGRWKHYAKYIEPALHTLKPLIDSFGYAAA